MFGRCTVHGATLRGVEAIPVEVEVAVTNGMPAFNIVGMADAAVQESRERVKTALKAAGFQMPGERVLVNLAPSSLRKTGSGFDLAIAVGILVATGQVDPGFASGALFVGELSLDGAVRSVNGMLAYALCARDYGLMLVCATGSDGLVPVDGLRVGGLDTLGELRSSELASVNTGSFLPDAERPDYADIAGNEMAKRALQIAAAGGHGVLMMGPPGSGKTMLASRLASIMPPLDEPEMLSAALIHSVAGEPTDLILAGRRPFRAPHHSATSAGLVGGGNPVRPGEVSLAHMGTLFLDEIPEYRPSVLQQLRQPLEEGCVRISRADGTIVFPAKFMLIAASNPCRCGYFGDDQRQCTCTANQVRDYQNRVGGPLMDRIDIHIDVRRVPASEVMERKAGTSSNELREGVMTGREYASWRKAHEEVGATSLDLIASCHLSDEDRRFFERAATANSMSGRGIVRTLSIARTIADMDQRRAVSKADLCEALSLRIREGVGA